MENKESIVSECIESLVRRAIAEMNATDAAAKTADRALSELSERVVGDSRLGGAEREVLDQYLTQLTQTTAEQFHYLYIQGAKDCVEVLRKLGIIK